jgi:hypothetical protein
VGKRHAAVVNREREAQKKFGRGRLGVQFVEGGGLWKVAAGNWGRI